jgi:dolichol-phosphate mannosyltransferase
VSDEASRTAPGSHRQAPAPPPAAEPSLTVVVPTYNERANVEPMYSRLCSALWEIPFEVIFVDDRSPDGTAEEIRAIARVDRRCRLITRSERRGLAGAALEGMLSAVAPVVAVIDGDLQHDETALPAMKAAIDAERADIVVTTRFSADTTTKNAPIGIRHRLSIGGGRLVRRLMKVQLTDPMSGYFMLRRSIVESVAPHINLDGFKILIDIVTTVPPETRFAEIPTTLRRRAGGQSKLDAKIILEFAALLLSRLTAGVLPLRFILFSFVGTIGLFVHLAATALALALGASFVTAQVIGTWVAMMSNFVLNNEVTHRHRKLRGRTQFVGLLFFYAVCTIGVIGNVGVATLLYQQQKPTWWLAALAGASIGTVWNYAVSATLVWRER